MMILTSYTNSRKLVCTFISYGCPPHPSPIPYMLGRHRSVKLACPCSPLSNVPICPTLPLGQIPSLVGQTSISNRQFNLSIQCPNQCSILNQDGSILKILINLKDFVILLLSDSINSCFSLNVCSKHVVFLVSWSNPPPNPDTLSEKWDPVRKVGPCQKSGTPH